MWLRLGMTVMANMVLLEEGSGHDLCQNTVPTTVFRFSLSILDIILCECLPTEIHMDSCPTKIQLHRKMEFQKLFLQIQRQLN
jgi:hypothetical protein